MDIPSFIHQRNVHVTSILGQLPAYVDCTRMTVII